ncbi:MAG: hypothetical protein ACYC7D_10055 [Nitrososphaerales archaeon]
MISVDELLAFGLLAVTSESDGSITLFVRGVGKSLTRLKEI